MARAKPIPMFVSIVDMGTVSFDEFRRRPTGSSEVITLPPLREHLVRPKAEPGVLKLAIAYRSFHLHAYSEKSDESRQSLVPVADEETPVGVVIPNGR